MNSKYKNKKYTTKLGELFTQITFAYEGSDSFRSEQAEDYIDAWKYYNLELPAQPIEGHCSYVSPVVRESLDRVITPQLNIFTATESSAVQYRPTGRILSKSGQPLNSSYIASAINKSINDIFLRENNGYEVYNEAFTETLLTGGSYVKWFVEEVNHEDTIEFEDWVPATVIETIMFEYPDTDFTQFEQKEEKIEMPNPQTGKVEKFSLPFIKGKADLLRVERKVKVASIPFSEVVVDEMATSINEARYLCHSKIYSAGALISMFPDKVDVITEADVANGLDSLDKRKLMVDGVFTESGDSSLTTTVDPMEKRVTLFEHYIYSSLLEGTSYLYRVYATHNDILEVEQVDNIPFAYGKAITIPGSFLGNSLYKLFKPFQDYKTNAIRVQQDNAAYLTYGRYTAVKGMYDRRSLLHNQPGGIVEVTQPGAVQPFQTHATPNNFESVYAKVAEDEQASMGLQAGMSFDPSSLNNIAASTMAMVMSNQELKDKRIAGTLARTLVRPLFEGLYRLLREEGVDLTLEDGSTFNTSQLPKVSNFAVDVTTATDEATTIANLSNVMQLDAQLSSVPNKSVDTRTVLKKIMKGMGMADDFVDEIMPEPVPPTPEQIEQAKVMQALEIEAKRVQVENMKAQTQGLVVGIAKAEVETSELIKDNEFARLRHQEDSVIKFQKADIDLFKAQLEQMALQLKGQEVAIEARKAEINEMSELNEIQLKAAELELERDQKRPVKIGI